ncbi:hypothetical protein AX15_000943 [Amanita polypyramis BW_CC]|nr:hypothetical protein AX15_000943 [Amanita polypyramis BW_CC]
MVSTHCAVIALGSNLGDRFRNIELALRLLEDPSYTLSSTTPSSNTNPQNVTLDIVDTSFMYETVPMYVTDQPSFINCACIVETSLEAPRLLELLKGVERLVGRVPGIRYGPRAVDLDIVFFDDAMVDTRREEEQDRLDNLIGELVVPHPRAVEREFVLRPINDMIPDYEHPIVKKTVNALLSELSIEPDAQPMRRVIPFPRYPIDHPTEDPHPKSIGHVPSTLTYWTHPYRTAKRSSSSSTSTSVKKKTHVMAIINVTPDSFSDGAQYDTVPAALAHACESVIAGASVLDIGGYSTRPGAGFVSTEQEIARVRPVVSAVRQAGVEGSGYLGENKGLEQRSKLTEVIISIDTFRPEVAETVILNGANCINDVHAFTGPEWWAGREFTEQAVEEADEYLSRMKEVARKYAVPVVLMHSRGDAGKNKDYSMYSYTEEAVVEGVRIELGEKVERIVKGRRGLRRWMVIVDIGIGFSKSVDGNLELLRSAAGVTADVHVGRDLARNPLTGYPQLIGPSRKSFFGALLEEGEHGRKTRPNERVWATAATVACAVHQDALVVRVHDVREMVDVVHISDAIWN